MDIPVNAAKPGRRRYLTLVMIFITVVICYVDRANLAVAAAHIQEEFGITKAEMGYVFSAFALALYAMSDPRRLVFRSRRFTRDLFYCDIWLVSGDVIPGLCHGINVINWSARDNRYFRSARFPDQ